MKRIKCKTCKGYGRIIEAYNLKKHGGKYAQWFIHPSPNGKPNKASRFCQKCNGVGTRVQNVNCGVPLLKLREAA